MPYVKVRRYLRQLLVGGKVAVINPDGRMKTYIHTDHDLTKSVVDDFYRDNNIDKVFTKGRKENEGKVSRYDMLKVLERQFEPVTVYDLVDILGLTEEEGEVARIGYGLYDCTRRGLVHRNPPADEVSGLSTYYIPYPDDTRRREMIEREIPVGYLYDMYTRYKVYLDQGKIPHENGTHIIECIEYTDKVGDTTPKEIDLKIRVYNKDEWIYTIDINNDNTRIIFRDNTVDIIGGRECVEYIHKNMEVN